MLHGSPSFMESFWITFGRSVSQELPETCRTFPTDHMWMHVGNAENEMHLESKVLAHRSAVNTIHVDQGFVPKQSLMDGQIREIHHQFFQT